MKNFNMKVYLDLEKKKKGLHPRRKHSGLIAKVTEYSDCYFNDIETPFDIHFSKEIALNLFYDLMENVKINNLGEMKDMNFNFNDGYWHYSFKTKQKPSYPKTML